MICASLHTSDEDFGEYLGRLLAAAVCSSCALSWDADLAGIVSGFPRSTRKITECIGVASGVATPEYEAHKPILRERGNAIHRVFNVLFPHNYWRQTVY
jgi:hypothetical protein